MILLVLAASLALVLACGCTDDNSEGAAGTVGAADTLGADDIIGAAEPVGDEIFDEDIAEAGDTVYVDYIGTYNNGTVFDMSEEGQPIEFVLGDNSTISGFENAIYGMKINETKSIDLTPDEAYGEHNDSLIFNISRDNIPEDTLLYPGAILYMYGSTGSLFPVTVLNSTNETVWIDANNPMAGKELNFDITLVGLEKAE